MQTQQSPGLVFGIFGSICVCGYIKRRRRRRRRRRKERVTALYASGFQVRRVPQPSSVRSHRTFPVLFYTTPTYRSLVIEAKQVAPLSTFAYSHFILFFCLFYFILLLFIYLFIYL